MPARHRFTYDKWGRITQDIYNDGETVEYQYDNSGMLATVVDSESGIKATYYYDLIDRLCRYEEAGRDYSFIMEYECNDRNQVSQMVQTMERIRFIDLLICLLLFQEQSEIFIFGSMSKLLISLKLLVCYLS